MIRLRFGQTWRREGVSPVDSVALTLHDVDLLVGANEEHLPEVVEAWSRAWQMLGSPEGELAQVSLPESRLELLLRRLAPSVLELTVVNLGRPARVARPALRVEVGDLRKAWVAGVGALWRDLEDANVPEVAAKVLAALEAVRKVSPVLPENTSRGSGYSYRVFPRAPAEIAFEIQDFDERLLAHRAGGTAPLASLLVPGTVSLQLPARTLRYSPPSVFLFALEASRQGQDFLAQSGDEPTALELGGFGPVVATDRALLPALFRLGVDLAFAVESRNPAHRDNPYLRELVDRCQNGLRELKARYPSPTPPDGSPSTADSPAVTSAARRTAEPLDNQGRLKRLKFVQRYERKLTAAESASQIIPLPGGKVWVCGTQWAERYDKNGGSTAHRESEQGISVFNSDWAVVAEGRRVLGYQGAQAGARWLQPHDGLALGPSLLQQEGLLFTQSENRVLVAHDARMGREIWRFTPFRPARIFARVFGSRAVVGTEAGDLFGLSASDGQLRYRFEAPLPFVAPPVALGTSFVATLSAGEHSALVSADLESGKLGWTHELPWSNASEPLVTGGRVWLAGQKGTRAYLVCLSAEGQPRFEIELPFVDARYFLVPLGRSVLVSGPRGAAARISAKGQIEYSVAAASEAAWRKLPPRAARGVVFLPGDPLRVMDAKTGHLLSELRGGPALVALETDRQLNVYALDEGGTFKAFRLQSHFSVLE
jgi:hypothetical protein